MNIFAELNDYRKTLSSDWGFYESYDEGSFYLINSTTDSRFMFEFHQRMMVENGVLTPRFRAYVELIDAGSLEDEFLNKMELELSEIITKFNTNK